MFGVGRRGGEEVSEAGSGVDEKMETSVGRWRGRASQGVRVEEVFGGNWRGRRSRGVDDEVDKGCRWASN
jgi:hypothetical protein